MIAAAYLDTSALLRLFLQEKDSDLVANVVKDVTALYASRLVLAEARISLSRARRESRLTPEDHRAVQDALEDFWTAEIEPLEISETVFTNAEQISERLSLRTLDALHLASARILRRELAPNASLAFIACDQRLLEAAQTIQFLLPIPPRS